MTSTPPRYPAVLWDVAEAHLDEAEFAVETLEAALAAPDYSLEELRGGPEARLLANVDGLVLQGEEVHAQLLAKVLEEPGEHSVHRVVASAMALFEAGGRDAVLRAAGRAPEVARAPFLRACALAGDSAFDGWLARTLRSGESAPGPALLLPVAAERQLDGVSVDAALARGEGAELAAALSLACRAAPRPEVVQIERRLDDPDVRVRDAALLAGVHLDSRLAWARCHDLALEADPPDEVSLVLVAAAGTALHRQLLVRRCESSELVAPALRALGFCGDIAVVEPLIDLAASEDLRTARLAGEALATLTGVGGEGFEREADGAGEVLEAEGLPPLERDDLDADLVPRADRYLPVPDAAAYARWWRDAKSRFSPTERYLGGAPWSTATALDALQRFPLRRRHLVALLLSIATGGGVHVNTRALSAAQRRQMGSAPRTAPFRLEQRAR